jgi:hypothetical protein
MNAGPERHGGASPGASNGEVEGPHRSAGPWRRGRTISQRPRRQARSTSRTPPTIVRSHDAVSHGSSKDTPQWGHSSPISNGLDALRGLSLANPIERPQRGQLSQYQLTGMAARKTAAHTYVIQRTPRMRLSPEPSMSTTNAARSTATRSRRRFSRTSRILTVTPNGEVEGPHRSPGPWRRGRTISQRPRRQADNASRTPPTIVRRTTTTD